MINIEYPLFKIPEINKKDFKKPGWGSEPKFFWDKKNFEEIKRQRLSEVDSMLNIAQRKPAFSKIIWDKAFFEMKFHSKALSKSAQPKKLLDYYNIDIHAHKKEWSFFVSSTLKNLIEFRNGIGRLSLQNNKKDSALLSAITEIKPIDKDEIWIIENDNQKVFIYLHDAISEKEGETIYKEAVKQYNLQDTQFFISNSNAKILYWVFPSNFLDDISESVRWPAQKIEKVYDIEVSRSEITDYSFDDVEIEEPILNSIVVVVDSGIEHHKILEELLIERKDFVNNEEKSDRYHWTMVWSRIVFWSRMLDDLQKNGKLTAESKIVDLHILRKEDSSWKCTVNPKELIDAIKQTLDECWNKYKIYNLSLNSWYPCDPLWSKDFLTRELDTLAYNYNVLFVVSAGNHTVFSEVKYPDCLDSSDSKITSPADWINILTVWSIADNESLKSIAKDNEPSPFTRTGFPNIRKPDVVHYWWNVDRYGRSNWLWVIGLLGEKNKIVEDVGTSFSTPIVSQIAWKIYAYLQNTGFWVNPPIELVKALIIHSAHYNLPNDSNINLSKINQYVGYWIPDFLRAINSFKNSATFIYTGIIWELVKENNKEQLVDKHKILIDVPTELEGKNKKIRIKWTLVYLPPVSSSWETDYAMSDISLNIYYLNSNGKRVPGKLTQSDKDYRIQWNPVKTFEITYSAFKWWKREILLQHLVRWDLDPKDFQQKYALIISIEDASDSNSIDLHQIIKNKYKQYIPLQQEIKVPQKMTIK